MDKITHQLYSIISLILSIISVSGILIIYYDFSKPLPDPIKIITTQANTDNTPNLISFETSGAINNPGKYSIIPGSTVEDAINLSGGLHQNADIFSSSLDMSATIYQDQQIYVPFSSHEENGTPNDKININTASLEELTTLKGIGEVTANKIIEYRQVNHFDNIEDIMNIKGIGEKIFAAISGQITT